MVQTRNKKKETRNQDSKGRRGFLVSVFSFSSLIGNNNLGSTQDELGLLAGPAGFLLLGHKKRTHAFHAFAADALMQGRVVTRADHGIVGMDAVAEKCGLDF